LRKTILLNSALSLPINALSGLHGRLALVDALGNLVRFVLLPGNRYDTIGVVPLIDGVAFDALLALSRDLLPCKWHCRAMDKAFDANWIIEEMKSRNASICISQRPQRKEPLEIDEEMYKWRHPVENFFCDGNPPIFRGERQ
jgi:hypothetical protein